MVLCEMGERKNGGNGIRVYSWEKYGSQVGRSSYNTDFATKINFNFGNDAVKEEANKPVRPELEPRPDQVKCNTNFTMDG